MEVKMKSDKKQAPSTGAGRAGAKAKTGNRSKTVRKSDREKLHRETGNHINIMGASKCVHCGGLIKSDPMGDTCVMCGRSKGHLCSSCMTLQETAPTKEAKGRGGRKLA